MHKYDLYFKYAFRTPPRAQFVCMYRMTIDKRNVENIKTSKEV